MSIFANADAYKLSHWVQYPEGTEYIYSNITPRFGEYFGLPYEADQYVMVGGIIAFCEKLNRKFKKKFFGKTKSTVLNEYVRFYENFFDTPASEEQISKVAELHDLGYLPIRIRGLSEGSMVEYGVPILLLENTLPGYYWLVGWVESWMNAEIWPVCNSATTAAYYRRVFDIYAERTSDSGFIVPFQGHDFSFRGMMGLAAAKLSGMGHLMNFKGTDTCPAISSIERAYIVSDTYLIGTSVPATEHSVMSAGGDDEEFETFKRFLTKVYPKGILSVVSDTWDFWDVITTILPKLKGTIMERDGKLVIRPDSGDPVLILCGDPDSDTEHEQKGLIECLWDLFGGTMNSKGYKELDSHIGAIYGDSITLSRQYDILRLLEEKGFASTNVVLGIGSFTYQFTTRDVHGIAMKATSGRFNGVQRALFKNPKTGSAKKSHRGLLNVGPDDNGIFRLSSLSQDVSLEEYERSLHRVYFEDSTLRMYEWSEVCEQAEKSRANIRISI